MLTSQQKTYLTATIVLVVILSLVTFWRRSTFVYQDTTDYAKLAREEKAQNEAYQKLLASIQPDPVASQQVFKKIVTEADVKKQVEAALDIKQKVVTPDIADSKLNVSEQKGKEAVEKYLVQSGQTVGKFNAALGNASQMLFSPTADSRELVAGAAQGQALLDTLYQISLPAEAKAFHKAQLTAFQSLVELIKLAQSYSAGQEVNPWPKVYSDYFIANAAVANLGQEFNVLNQKYSLDAEVLKLADASQKTLLEKLGAIRPAQAFLGAGDTTVIVGNIPQAIIEAVKKALAASFGNFISQFLDKLIAQIENNYRIANFLYYSDALVRGQYVNDYLNKYVSNPLDQQIITRFIPQFSCGASQGDLQAVFQAKAREYLGYDPANLNLRDPDFYLKLKRAGDFFASPQGWELYYQGLAAQAESAAQKAVDRELASSGLKSPRDLVGKQITASLSSIANAETAALNASLNLGVVNVENLVGQLVSGIVSNLFNKFLFQGAVVAQEQSACLPVPQLKPVIPVSPTAYQTPEKPPSPESLLEDFNIRGNR